MSLPAADIAAHRNLVPWTDTAQVEQDLLLRVLAIGIAGDPALGGGLVWRGGTCLHTLVLDRPRRYSEDLDYVQVAPGLSKGDIADAVRSIAAGLGMDVTKVDLKGNRANVRVAHPSSVGGDIAIKVEVNTEDVAALHPLRLLPMSLRTRQFGQLHADVQTFSSAELIGSKFRALAQRRKGRDLSDVWLARHALDVDDDELADVGDHYLAAAGVSPAALRQGLHEHLGDVEFLADLDTLVAVPYEGYDPEVFGRSLIIWSDSRLDPRFDARRSLNAGRRDRARRQKEGEPDPPLPRCPQYEDAGGSLQRCRSWPDDGVCKMHGALPPPL